MTAEGQGPPGAVPYLGTTDHLVRANTEVIWLGTRDPSWKVNEIIGDATYTGVSPNGRRWTTGYSWTPPPEVIPPEGTSFSYVVAIMSNGRDPTSSAHGRMSVQVEGMKPDGTAKPLEVGHAFGQFDAREDLPIAPKWGKIVGNKATIGVWLAGDVIVKYNYEYRTPARPPNP